MHQNLFSLECCPQSWFTGRQVHRLLFFHYIHIPHTHIPYIHIPYIHIPYIHITYTWIRHSSKRPHKSSHAVYSLLHVSYLPFALLELHLGAKTKSKPDLRKCLHCSSSLRSSVRSWIELRPSCEQRSLRRLPVSKWLSMFRGNLPAVLWGGGQQWSCLSILPVYPACCRQRTWVL